MKGTILHLCADIGSDSLVWKKNGFEVIHVGKNIGVENFSYKKEVFGIIANPPCLEFSTVRTGGKARDSKKGMFLVNECLRIIRETNPCFWVLENPATGDLKKQIGEPRYTYQPWWFGSPWTKKTSLWGDFKIPKREFFDWNEVLKNKNLYIRPGRKKPSLVSMHKNHINFIPEFKDFIDIVDDDMSFRSLCSQKFSQAFFEANRGDQ